MRRSSRRPSLGWRRELSTVSFLEAGRTFIHRGLVLLSTVAVTLTSSVGPAAAREQIKVDIARPLTANVSSFSTLPGAERGYLPGLMTRTPAVTGSVSAAVVKPDIYKAWLSKTHPQFALKAARNSPDSVIVVKGQWDNSKKTLEKLGMPHREVSSGEFASMPLDGTRVVIVDCEGNLDQKARQKLRQFVIRGGYLLSTDWDLDGFLDSTFMQYLSWNKAVNRNLIYDATVVDADPILFRNTVTDAPWKLDLESHLIRVNDRSRVRVLIESRRLKEEDPDRAGVLAAVFAFGRGYVLHMAGHFDNNSGVPVRHRLPDPAPVIEIGLRQALAANFVVAGLTGARIRTGRSQ